MDPQNPQLDLHITTPGKEESWLFKNYLFSTEETEQISLVYNTMLNHLPEKVVVAVHFRERQKKNEFHGVEGGLSRDSTT